MAFHNALRQARLKAKGWTSAGRIAWLLLLLTCPLLLHAQDLEYQMEVGGMLGPVSYMGDISSSPFTHINPMGGFVLRRNLNQRMVLKGNLLMGRLSGESKGVFLPTDANSQTPEGGEPIHVKFARSIVDLGVQYEQNFWGYGRGAAYKELSPITPYATLGLGLTLAMGGGPVNAGLNIPVGLGVKYKLMPRLNVGAEFTARFTTSDKLDVTRTSQQLNSPYGIKSGFLKNADCYACLLFFVTYDISPKFRKCNN